MNAVAERLPAGVAEFPNGTFTFHNVEKDTHKTIRIRTAKNSNRRWVSVMTGSNNETDYSLVGEVIEGGLFKAHYTAPVALASLAAWCLQALKAKSNGQQVKGLSIEESRQCCRCNRKLTAPSSISANIGPECAKYY